MDRTIHIICRMSIPWGRRDGGDGDGDAATPTSQQLSHLTRSLDHQGPNIPHLDVCVHIHIYPQVPAHVRDDTTGKPVFHGVVDRCYNRFPRCVQLYCLVKQEESLLCTEYRRCIVHTHTPSSATSPVSFTSCHSCHLMF